MVKVFIDHRSIEVLKGTTVLQACLQIGVEIPRFCYHERLSIAGNCRMCLVEVEKSPKPVASCAMPVVEGMKIRTSTPLVKKAREGVLEFLLVNHPLDCPICDQGGECDLQDLTMVYGSDRGRFHEYKRGVEDKNIGPLIKTIMTRCIHCTRCVRFASEIAGVQEIGTVGRGKDTEISTYIQKIFHSELSGNIIDLCPVGALTSKPYAFTARSWELKTVESIDLTDAVGSNIRIDVRGSEIMRILPRLNEEINEEWITDKTRFSYDGLKRQRLQSPMIRVEGTESNYRIVNWKDAFSYIAQKINEEIAQRKNKKENSPFSTIDIKAVIGKHADLESTYLLKKLIHKMGSNDIYLNRFSLLQKKNKQEKKYHLTYESVLSSDLRENYLLNTQLTGFEKTDFCLLIGCNPRFEAPLLNLRLRKAHLQKGLKVFSIGSNDYNLTYPYEKIGNDFNSFVRLIEGRHKDSKCLFQAKFPTIILGMDFIIQNTLDMNTNYLFDLFYRIKNIYRTHNHFEGFWNGLNILHADASSVGSLDLGIEGKKIYLKNAHITETNKNDQLDTRDVKESRKSRKPEENTEGMKSQQKSILYLLNADDFEFQKNLNQRTNKDNLDRNINDNLTDISDRLEKEERTKDIHGKNLRQKDLFIIYQGHHGDFGANNADIILPGAAYTEKNSYYTNMEGRVQNTRTAFLSPGNSREDWKIIQALSEVLGFTNTKSEITPNISNLLISSQQYQKKEITPYIEILKQLYPIKTTGIQNEDTVRSESNLSFSAYRKYSFIQINLKKTIQGLNKSNSFYLTDPICRASQTMARCSTLYHIF